MTAKVCRLQKGMVINMKILIVSDTHHRNENYLKVLQKVGKVDMVIHLGDVEGSEYTIQEAQAAPLRWFAAIMIFFSELPSEKTLQIGKYRVMITHGHRYYIGMGNEMLKQEAIAHGADIVMYGHTHTPGLCKIKNFVLLTFPCLSQRQKLLYISSSQLSTLFLFYFSKSFNRDN